MRYVLPAAVAPLVLAGAWWAQSGQAGRGAAECEARCIDDPDAAPAECACEAFLAAHRAAGGSVQSIGEIDPAEWWAERRKAEAERMASVENYLLVETLNIAPMPVITYHEKVPPVADEPPSFRSFGVPELAQREWKDRAAKATTPDEKAGAGLMADPGAFLGVLAAGLDELGSKPGTGIEPGAGSEGLSKLADALRKLPADMKAQDAADLQERASQEREFDDFIITEKMYKQFTRLTRGVGLYYPDREPAAARFERRSEKNIKRGGQGQIELCGKQGCTPVPWDALLCTVETAKGPIKIKWQERPVTITEIQVWEASDPYFKGPNWQHRFEGVLVLRRIVGIESTIGGPRAFVFDREEDDFRPAGPMLLAHRTRERMETDGQATPEIVRSVIKVEVNEGPPSQAEITEMMIETLGKFLPGGG